MESYTLPCESYIYIEGKLRKPSDAVGDIRFSNNGLAILFSEISDGNLLPILGTVTNCYCYSKNNS